jgi:hypothetical protein
MRITFLLPALAALAAWTLPGAAGAQQIADANRGATVTDPGGAATATAASAVRAASAPALDGRLDDEVWRTAAPIDQFLEYEPNEGAATRFRTEARIAYDNRNLYVAVRMYDPAPDSIVSLLARRDVRAPSEQLKIVIDSYHDRRTAYQFAVNPAGVKRDFYVYNDNNEDASWDAVWDVATAIDSLGWTAEFAIPLSQLRYANRAEHTFGLMIVRDIARTGQRISWPLYRRSVQGYVSQAGTVSGIRGLPTPRRLEVLPYVVTKNETRGSDDEGWAHPQETTAGADVKFGLSSNLTLDATINPDFGQVEADPAVLNLSAFETFFEERRPFFLEGTGIFSFRTDCNDIDTGCRGLFYSRRIGRAPQLSDVHEIDDGPVATTILGAGKITGRLARGLSIGLLDAVTQEERAEDPARTTIEPQTNYLVARAQQSLNRDRSDVGVMFTAVNRRLGDESEPFLRRAAYALGLDARHRFIDNKYEAALSLASSRVEGSEEAIAATQLSTVHAYQRPDDDVAFDPTRTSLGGDMQRLSISKFGGGNTRFQTVYQRFSPGFEINDVGFQQRADDQLFRNWFQVAFRKPTRLYRQMSLNFNHFSNWSAGGERTGLGFNQNSHTEFANRIWFHLGFNYNNFAGNTFDDRMARGGPAVRRDTDFNFWAGLEGDNRKRLTPYVWWGGGRSDGGRSSFFYVEPQVEIRAASNVTATVGAYAERAINDNQWYGNFADDDGTAHYTFANLEQTTVSLTARLNYIFTPNLTLQFYGQPFVSTGGWRDLRELRDPRADEYEDRYQPYDSGDELAGFKFMQFQSNTVLRWEYRPGSTLFFVWSQGRDAFVGARTSEFDFRRNYEDLFQLHPRNTFLIKASYWFNP